MSARTLAAYGLLVLSLALSFSRRASADVAAPPAPPGRATFALIIGTNQSVDASLPVLKYADDDAAQYLDLFRLLGARTYLLTRLDENTRNLHPQAVAEADPPRRAPLERALRQLTADVATANARRVETIVYFVYAGHGDVKNGQGYISLEDANVSGAELAQMVAGIPATHVHVIVDACGSYFLAGSRGPGGERRVLAGLRASALTDDPRVGVLLSTSSARESHEWEGFEGGVFSHEVRSGLYGAADANGDGEVSYQEIAAFVARANAAIPNERFRSDVYARPPPGSETLLDLRGGLRRRLVIDGAHAGHYFLEDARGVRIADAHNAAGTSLSLVRPSPGVPLYLRRTDDEQELLVPPGPDVVALSDLTPSEPRARARGAAHESFALIFSLPFDEQAVATYRPPRLETREEAAPSRRPPRLLGWTLSGAGAAVLGLGAGLSAASVSTAHGVSAGESESAVAKKNAQISALNTGAVIAYAVGGAGVVAGAAVLLWPSGKSVQVAVTPAGLSATYAVSF